MPKPARAPAPVTIAAVPGEDDDDAPPAVADAPIDIVPDIDIDIVPSDEPEAP